VAAASSGRDGTGGKVRNIAAMTSAVALLALPACKPVPPLKEYVYPAWNFAVSFRAPPRETDIPASADGKSNHGFVVESVLAGRDNLVNVIDGTGSTKSDDEVLSGTPKKLAGYVGGTLGPITYAASGTAMGREFMISRPDHPVTRVRIFVANKHLYEVISQTALGFDDPETVTFLDGFRLLKQPGS